MQSRVKIVNGQWLTRDCRGPVQPRLGTPQVRAADLVGLVGGVNWCARAANVNTQHTTHCCIVRAQATLANAASNLKTRRTP